MSLENSLENNSQFSLLLNLLDYQNVFINSSAVDVF